jgi:hypothetical protein
LRAGKKTALTGGRTTPSAGGHLAAEYEVLRREVLNGSGRGARLILFLRQGMRAWMKEELRSAAEAVAPQRTFDSAEWFPQPPPAEAVLLLAGMALGTRKEYVC